MPLPERMKLIKLKIKAYEKIDRQEPPFGTFEVMFNPTSTMQTYAIEYGQSQAIGSSGRQANFVRSKPRTLELKLILDDTGVQNVEPETLAPKPGVAEQVKQFLDLTF